MNRAFENDGPVDDWKNTNISVHTRDVIADAEVEIRVKVFCSCARKHVMKAYVNVTFLYAASV